MAANICGKPTAYDAVPYVWSDQLGGRLQIFGRVGADDEVRYVFGGPDEPKFVAVTGDGNRLTAVVGFGGRAQAAPVPQAARRGRLLAGGARAGRRGRLTLGPHAASSAAASRGTAAWLRTAPGRSTHSAKASTTAPCAQSATVGPKKCHSVPSTSPPTGSRPPQQTV